MMCNIFINNDNNFEKALEILDKIESLEGKSSELTAERLQQYLPNKNSCFHISTVFALFLFVFRIFCSFFRLFFGGFFFFVVE